MAVPTDNETWIIYAGDAVIRIKARTGLASLTEWELLVCCLWVADYGMRNAGDLDTAADVFADFHSSACRTAKALSLPLTYATFSQTQTDLERTYFDRFDSICDEIKRIAPSNPTHSGKK
jgi:hypothetical protein